ncbi:MAG: alpha/beta hydrolase, partial [Boseongicola sp.]
MLKAAVLVAATSYFAWYLERFELSMVYPFDKTYATPNEAGEARLNEARFATADGEELILWQSVAAATQPTLLYFPGNAGGLKDRADRFSALIDRGYGVVALAYRGSSGSSGAPGEAELTSDARAVARAMQTKPLVLYGESLGTAVAIKLASEGIGDAVVLEAPFTSIADLVAVQYPRDDLEHLLTQHWKSSDRISRLKQPLLIVHGRHDKIVPIEQGREVFRAAGSTDKQFLEVADRGHHNLWTVEMQGALYEF